MVEENGNIVGRPPTEAQKETKCFVCDVITSDGAVWLMELLSVNANLLESIGGLMGDGAFVIVSWDDVVCNACSLLLKYFTKLERDLVILKKVLRYYFKVKYHLEDDDLDSNTTINRQDIDYITECSAQMLGALDRKGPQLSKRTQTNLAMSHKKYSDKTVTVPQESMIKGSNSNTVSGFNQKGTTAFKKLETHNAAVQKMYHCENNQSSTEPGRMGRVLNVVDYNSNSKRQKYFMSHTLQNRNNSTKSLYCNSEVSDLLFKEGTIKNNYPPGKNVSTVSIENSNRKMNNVISITLNSDSEQEFGDDPCIPSPNNDHMVHLPFMKAPMSSALVKQRDSVTTQENKKVSEAKNKTNVFGENKNVMHETISSGEIKISDKTKQKKSDFNPLVKQIGNSILNQDNVASNSVASIHSKTLTKSTKTKLPKCTGTTSNSDATICTKTVENFSQKEKSKCSESTFMTPPQLAINEEQFKSTGGLESSDQMSYLSFTKTLKRPEKDTSESPSSENLMKIIEDNQILIHSAQNEWLGGLEMGLDDMPHIVLGDEMIVDGSTIEEIAFEETQNISTSVNENSYCERLEMVKSNISKQEDLNAFCPSESETDFRESNNIVEIRTAVKEDESKTPQSNSRGNKSAIPETSNINNERTILRSCGVKSQTSLLMQENVSHISPYEKIFKCHICNRILTTQSNLKRHLLKHKKCAVGPVMCELCNEQLVDRVHLKQHLKVQHQQSVKCAFCDKEFSNMKLCRDHELTHPERANYKCDICNQMFVTEGRLKNHKELIHDDLCDTFRENEFFKCHICFKTLRTLHNLKRHFTTHEKSPVSVSCNLCQEIFADKSKLYQHREEKHPKKYICTFCNKEFESSRSCRIHESLHPERVVYKCNICETVFLTESRLNRHKDIHHRDPYCRICGKEITDRSKLIEHEKRHGRFQQVFMCKECPKVFRTASGLKYHMSVHTGKYAVYCEICGKGLHSEIVLAEHKATHTKEVRYTCELCGRTFSSNSTYRMHRRWHDNPLPYQCNFCDKKFKHTSILAVHKRRVHTGERPYKCKYCNMAFSVSSTRNKHLILHTKQYPYKCEQCNKGFTTRTKIANHLAKVHNDDSMLNAGKKVCEYKMALRPSEMADVESSHEFPADEIEEIVL